ncbi:MAG: hypothetical protein HKN41_03875, partial [Ilumatobacter sp.]|nr:hypothetical protein [Ilumatobacter sp.]
MTVDRFVYGLAVVACVVGLVTVAMAWSARRRDAPASSRLRHPATPAPVTFSMEHGSTGS